MKTAVAASLVAGLVTISTVAHAGAYVGLGIGPEPASNDALQKTANPDSRSLRGLSGWSFGNFAVEGALGGFGVATNRGDQNVYQLSAAAKYSLPIGSGFAVFGRAGVERTWLNLGDDRYNFSGNGFLIGAGVDYKLNLGIGATSISLDYMIHHATLADTRENIDDTLRIWTLGFSIGL